MIGLLGCRLFVPQSSGSAPTGSPSGSGLQPPNQSPAPERFTLVKIPNSNDDLTTILAGQAALAQQAGRRPFVDFYADWCAPCKSLEKNLGAPSMVDAFDGTYIIRLNLDDWKERLPAAGFRVPGIPAFYAIDLQGKPSGRMITGAAWGEDIPANMAPPLKEFFQKK
jgi:thiol-disulfide isomerase/thioredoxin